MTSRTDGERMVDGRRRGIQLSLWWAGIIFAAVAMTTFAVSIENGRPTWQASSFALVSGVLAVAGVVVLDAMVGRRGVRIVAHVLPGVFVLFIAFLLTALQLADWFLTPPLYAVLVGLWIVGFSLTVGGVFVYRGTPHQVRRVAKVGLGASLVWGLPVIGYAVISLLSQGWNAVSGVTAGAVASGFLLIALVGIPSLVFLWDLRETRPEGWTHDERGCATRLSKATVLAVERDQPMRFDALRQRVQIPLPWAATIFLVIAVGVFAGTWLSGSPIWLVVLSTVAAALLAGIGLTTTGPILGNRTFRLVAHAILGLFVLVAALFVTLLGAAAGALTLSLVNVVVLGSIWGLGIALILAASLIVLEAHRHLRWVATFGLALAAVWGLVVVVLLGGIAVRLLLEGFDLTVVQDLRDDLIPFLVVSIAFVVLPALVFRQDLRELQAQRVDQI